uniref:Uncharacterized protein n=1 Tax=Nothobranchius furzeri TaxID=105023 RepID=A0A1A8UJK6_NOTFU
MGPKRINNDEVDEIKKSLDFLAEELTTVRQQQKSIMDLVQEVKKLKQQNAEKDKQIYILQKRVDELEQYSRINDVVITGVDIKPRSYARAVANNNGEEPTETDMNHVERQVTTFFHSKGIEISENNIEACHVLSSRNRKGKVSVLMRFVSRKMKNSLLKQAKKLKGSEVYVNEHLTKYNAEIAKKARFLRKQKKIQGTWTANCKIFVKLNGTPEEAKILVIKSLEDLDQFQ